MTDALKKPLLLPALLTGKCPNCRRGYVWTQHRIFPLGTMLRLKDNCEICGQRLLHERNNGGGINYALTMILFFLNLVWYWPIFGMSYLDNSIFWYLGTSITVVVLLQPWLMRFSRMIYLYFFIQYGKGALQ